MSETRNRCSGALFCVADMYHLDIPAVFVAAKFSDNSLHAGGSLAAT